MAIKYPNSKSDRNKMNKINYQTCVKLSWDDVQKRAQKIAKVLEPDTRLYGIPRGGLFAASLICGYDKSFSIVEESVELADVFIDDIIDSGQTEVHYIGRRDLPFFALVDKRTEREFQGKWVSFPWERMINEMGPEENIRRLIEYIGDDPDREGLKETPNRVISSYARLFGGYKEDPKNIIKTFKDDSCDEMVVLKNIEFYSTCEYHMLPFYGRAHIAYIPNGQVVGISKLARLLEIYSRRLQIQERICNEVTRAIDDLIHPKGSACILEAQHFCMTSRGVEKQNSIMITSSLTGVFKTSIETRAEFISLTKEK